VRGAKNVSVKKLPNRLSWPKQEICYSFHVTLGSVLPTWNSLLLYPLQE